MNPQVKPSHYFRKEYDSKGRFISYWHQIHEIIKLKPKKVLEIGTGSGFVSEYLKKREIKIVTLDIDESLNPDYVSSVLDLPFANESFDVVACYEVLEHLPYKDFNRVLSEVFRVSKLYVLLSLPDVTRVYRFNIQIPKIGEIKKLITIPRRNKIVHQFDGEHYWEIGKKGYPLSRIIVNIQNVGFKINKTYRIFENPYHRFFILKKTEDLLKKSMITFN